MLFRSERLRVQQALKPHVPRHIELALLDISLLQAEGKPDKAAACLSNLLLSQPLADYRAILQIEGAVFAGNLRHLAGLMEIPAVIAQRLAHVLDEPLPPSAVRPSGPPATDPAREPSGLTERERSVMRLLSSGLSNKEIGRQLDLSDNTVKFHLRNIFAKLNVTTRTAAVMASRDTGVLR